MGEIDNEGGGVGRGEREGCDELRHDWGSPARRYVTSFCLLLCVLVSLKRGLPD